MNTSTKRDDSNNAITRVPFRTAFNYNPDQVSLESGITFKEPTLTQQHQRDETDINIIVQRFGVTGMLPQAAVLPTYGDFTASTDFQASMNLIIQAQEAFDALPAKTRQYFDHDPGKLLEFIDAGPDAQLVLDLGLGHVVSPAKETAPPAPAPAPPPPPGDNEA